MRIVFAGALLATAAVIASVSRAEEAPAPSVTEPADASSADAQPCLMAGPEEAAVAAMMPSGLEGEAALPQPCIPGEPSEPGNGSVPEALTAVAVVAQPIQVGPPPRNLTGRRIYRP